MKQTFLLWVFKFEAHGMRWHCLSCFDILFSQSRSNSEASVHKLQSGSSGTLGSPPLFSPLHILCFPKALLIWILGVIKKSSWKHPIHLKFRFIWIFSHETLVECMPRDPKECKAFKLYIQALRSLADRWHRPPGRRGARLKGPLDAVTQDHGLTVELVDWLFKRQIYCKSFQSINAVADEKVIYITNWQNTTKQGQLQPPLTDH